MRFELENKTRPIVKNTRTTGKIFLLKDKNINLIKSPTNNYAILKILMCFYIRIIRNVWDIIIKIKHKGVKNK